MTSSHKTLKILWVVFLWFVHFASFSIHANADFTHSQRHSHITLPDSVHHLFHENSRISPQFKNLFKTLKAPYIPQNLDDVFLLVQGKHSAEYTWLRQGERFDVKADGSLTNKQAAAVISFCVNGGFFKKLPPPAAAVKGLLIMGSTLSRLRAQVLELNKALDKQPSLAAIPVIFIGGERPLAESAGETQEALYAPPSPVNPLYKTPTNRPTITDERDMIRLVAQQSLSSKFRVVEFILPPKQPNKARATTMDGLKLWFESTIPQPGVYAIISSNPYATYQELVATEAALRFHRPDVAFVACGPTIALKEYRSKMGDIALAKILLDNLARIIYELHVLKSLKNAKPI